MKNIFVVRAPESHEIELRKRMNGDEDGGEDEGQGKVIPWIEAIKILKTMKLPVYISEEGEY